MKFRSAALSKACLALIGVVVPLLILEISFRFLYNQKSTRWNDRPRRYYYPQNSHSFQDHYYPKTKASNAIRLAVVGDSFTYGPYLQFEDTFPKRLEQILNYNEDAPKVEVMNVGVCGYSTKREVDLVRQLLAEYHPDRILLEITLNDPEIEPYRVMFHHDTTKKSWLSQKLKTVDFISTRLANWNARKHYKDYYFELFENPKTWNNFVAGIDEILDLTKKTNVKLEAVIFPLFSHKIDASYPFAPLHNKIQNLLRQKLVEYIDLTDSYTNIPPERLQIIPDKDNHPNEIAHRIAAESIYIWLSRRKVLPDSVFAVNRDKFRSDQMRGRLPI